MREGERVRVEALRDGEREEGGGTYLLPQVGLTLLDLSAGEESGSVTGSRREEERVLLAAAVERPGRVRAAQARRPAGRARGQGTRVPISRRLVRDAARCGRPSMCRTTPEGRADAAARRPPAPPPRAGRAAPRRPPRPARSISPISPTRSAPAAAAAPRAGPRTLVELDLPNGAPSPRRGARAHLRRTGTGRACRCRKGEARACASRGGRRKEEREGKGESGEGGGKAHGSHDHVCGRVQRQSLAQGTGRRGQATHRRQRQPGDG